MIYLLLLTCCLCVFATTTYSWQTILVQQVKREYSPAQVTLFENCSNDRSSSMQKLLREFMSKIPTVYIDMQSYGYDNRSLIMQVHKNPRAARILYVILQDRGKFDRSKKIIKSFVELAPIPSRPKCLLVIFDHSNISELSYRLFFEYTWFLKFLEFPIIKVDKNSTPEVIDYNPFLCQLSRNRMSSCNKIFTKKLNDIYQYPLKVNFRMNFPLTNNFMNEELQRRKIYDFYIIPLQIFIKKINASVIGIPVGKIQLIYSQLFNNTANFHSLPSLLGSSMFNPYIPDMSFLHSRVYSTAGLVFIVPKTLFSKLNFPPDLIVTWFCLIFMLVSLKLIMKILIIRNVEEWSIGKLLKLAFGVPVNREFSNMPERMIAASLMLLSITYSTELIANLMDVKLLNHGINNLDAVLESGLPIQCGNYIFNHILKNDHEFEKFRKRVNIVSDNGADDFFNNDKQIHILPLRIPTDYLSEHPEIHMKVINQLIHPEFLIYMFEKASPYVDCFNDVFTRIIEAGIVNIWDLNRKQKSYDLKEKSSNESSILFVVMIVMLIGYGIASLIFIVEIIVYFLKKNCRIDFM